MKPSVMILLWLILLISANSIPVYYNVSAGRNSSYTNWCVIPILPSHAGYPWNNLPVDLWGATYKIFYSGVADEIQFTAAQNGKDRGVQMLIINASAEVKYEKYIDSFFTITWGTVETPIYMGFLNSQSNNYCYITAIKYGICATNTGPKDKC